MAKDGKRYKTKMCRAYLDLLIGCMFSGKSTELIRRIERFQFAKKRCVVLKWSKDVRGDEEITELSTHGGHKISCIRVNKLMTFAKYSKNYDVIGVDDGQFFPDIEEFCEMMVDKEKKIVIVAGLDADFRRNPFENIIRLVSKAEKVKKLSAICTVCGRKAHFSALLSKKNFEEREVIQVGGMESYTALCRRCYLKT